LGEKATVYTAPPWPRSVHDSSKWRLSKRAVGALLLELGGSMSSSKSARTPPTPNRESSTERLIAAAAASLLPPLGASPFGGAGGSPE
jgi:hypothetical protein